MHPTPRGIYLSTSSLSLANFSVYLYTGADLVNCPGDVISLTGLAAGREKDCVYVYICVCRGPTLAGRQVRQNEKRTICRFAYIPLTCPPLALFFYSGCAVCVCVCVCVCSFLYSRVYISERLYCYIYWKKVEYNEIESRCTVIALSSIFFLHAILEGVHQDEEEKM